MFTIAPVIQLLAGRIFCKAAVYSKAIYCNISFVVFETLLKSLFQMLLINQDTTGHGFADISETICANLDFYSGFIYEMIGIPRELYTPIFAMSRIVGWCAHRLEELNFEDRRIIRPAYMNVAGNREYRPMKKR